MFSKNGIPNHEETDFQRHKCWGKKNLEDE